MLKIKLEDRITVSFAGLFLILILLSNLLTIYFLKKQSLSRRRPAADTKGDRDTYISGQNFIIFGKI